MKRTLNEKKLDFKFIKDKLDLGLSFELIAEELNAIRPYSLKPRTLEIQYNKFMNLSVLANAPDQHLHDLLLELDIAMDEAIKAWRNSIGKESREIKSTYYSVTRGTSTSEVIAKMKTAGNPKYLQLYLMALKQKQELLAPKKDIINTNNQFNINNFMDTVSIVDKQQINNKAPLRNEQDAINFGKTL